MLGLGLALTNFGSKGGVSDSADGGFSAEATTLFAAMTSQPDATRKALIDSTIVALKTAGIWDEIDAMFVLAAHDSQAALIDWKNPGTRSAVAVNSPTFTTDRGYQSDASTSRVRTNYTPSTNGVKFLQNDASMWVWTTTGHIEGARRAIGSNWATPYCNIITRNGTNFIQGSINSATNGQTLSGGTNTTAGLVGITRASSTTFKLWKNGAQSGSDVSDNSTGRPTNEQWMCGSYQTSFSNNQVAAGIWASSLTGKEAALYTALAAYMTGVGA